jgi:hypothetical protein
VQDINDLRRELRDLGERLVIDTDIIEHIIRDAGYCNGFYIIYTEGGRDDGGAEGLGALFGPSEMTDYFIMQLRKVKHRESESVGLIKSKSQFPEGCSDRDCVLAISKSGEDSDAVDMTRTAKSKGALAYVMTSNNSSELAGLADDLIYIRDEANFEKYGEMFLETTIHRLFYYIESEEHVLDGPVKIGIAENMELAKIERVVTTDYESPFLKRNNRNHTIAMVILALLIIIPCILILMFIKVVLPMLHII